MKILKSRSGTILNGIKHKKLVLISGLIIVALLSSAFFFTAQKKEPVYVVCPQAVVQKSSAYLRPEYITELKPIVDEILKHDNYSQEIDCAYIVAIYHVNKGDSASANESLSIVEEHIKDKKEISLYFNKSAPTVADLRSRLKFMETRQAELQRNSELMSGAKAR